MVRFPFRINSSFQTYPAHPITIPRGVVDYRDVEKESEGVLSTELVYPNGAVVPARICAGQAGFGDYRQIRSLKRAGWPSILAVKGEWVDIRIVCEKRLRIYVCAL